MRQLVRWMAALAAVLVLLGLAQGGVLASLDARLGDWRLSLIPVAPSGNTVVVEIDSQSLAEIGVWPWPRSLHARLLDQLMAAGADEVAFDIDFSSASAAFDDGLFTAALEQAGGYAWLAAFAQSHPDGSVSVSRPLSEFAMAADPVLVNVLLDPMTGQAHSFPIAASDAEGAIPALAVALARPAVALPPILEIDFAIDLDAIERVSFTDVLYGRIDPARLAGRKVIVGASAIELRDFFTVPRYGVISGPMLQALALETLTAGRILRDWGSLPGICIAALLGLILLLRRHRTPIPALAAGLTLAAALGEALALFAYGQFDIIVDTASLHIGLLFLFGLALADNGYGHLLARRTAQERLQFLASHDAVTGLLSRQGLLDLPPAGAPLMLALLQIRAMDELRASLGHQVTDRLLLAFSHRVIHCGFAEVARIGPAGFALVDLDHGDSDRLATVTRQLRTTLSGTYNVDGHNLHIEIVAGYSAGSASRSDLLNQAEIALLQARADRVAIRGFSPADQQALERHRQLDRDLRLAMSRNQLRLVFQPQVDLKSRRIVGAETLVRWDHPEFGPVSPVEFIALAEDTGFIVDLGRWILWEACERAMHWPEPIVLAVNVSPIQFQHENFLATVEAALRRSGLPADRLELEITETERVADPARVRNVMSRLQALGIRLSIDDFGTGYSALSYFRDLPFETVKIDQSFVRDRTSETDLALLAAIIRLSTSMGKLTIAEGVEDEATAARLTAMGCHFGQGYHFSRPVSGDDLISLLGKEGMRRKG